MPILVLTLWNALTSSQKEVRWLRRRFFGTDIQIDGVNRTVCSKMCFSTPVKTPAGIKTALSGIDAQPGLFRSNSATRGFSEPVQSGLFVSSASAARGIWVLPDLPGTSLLRIVCMPHVETLVHGFQGGVGNREFCLAPVSESSEQALALHADFEAREWGSDPATPPCPDATPRSCFRPLQHSKGSEFRARIKYRSLPFSFTSTTLESSFRGSIVVWRKNVLSTGDRDP